MFSAPKESMLKKYSVNLTERAAKNLIDPAWGRQREISRLTSILLKRSKNNPLILGDPGVGKTALVEELARSIANETCHRDLLDKQVLSLDVAGLIAGTRERGELEERVKGIMSEVENEDNLIIMIDEIHMLSAREGGSKSDGNTNAGSSVMNMLKPALARGTFTCIGATTYSEYSKYIMKDKAMERRFQTIILNEPDEEDTVGILMHIKSRYEEFHNCELSDEVVRHCVELAGRYLHYRPYPDKAIDLMDETCSKVKLDYHKRKRQDKVVTIEDVNDIVQSIMNVPLQITTDESIRMDIIDRELKSCIHGQSEALDTIVRTMKRHLCGFKPPTRPITSMLFIGPTGTGKTETTNMLADLFFGSRYDNIIRLDMSEYMTSNTVSTLVGAPAGYAGYEEDGILTKAIKNNPYSIVLFDEIEKAHYSIHNLLLQVLEDGILTNNKGVQYSFRNAIIIFTSNVGFSDKMQSGMGFTDQRADSGSPECMYNKNNIMNELRYTFRPEFLNRLDSIVPFDYLTNDVMDKIVNDVINHEISKINQTIRLNVVVSTTTRNAIIEQVRIQNVGARPIRSIVNNMVVDPICEKYLSRKGKSNDKNSSWIVI